LPYGETLAKLIPDASLTVLDGCGRLAYLEQPAAVADAILDTALNEAPNSGRRA